MARGSLIRQDRKVGSEEALCSQGKFIGFISSIQESSSEKREKEKIKKKIYKRNVFHALFFYLHVFFPKVGDGTVPSVMYERAQLPRIT